MLNTARSHCHGYSMIVWYRFLKMWLFKLHEAFLEKAVNIHFLEDFDVPNVTRGVTRQNFAIYGVKIGVKGH